MRQVLQRADSSRPRGSAAHPAGAVALARLGVQLDSLELLPRIPWYRTMAGALAAGRSAAPRRASKSFLAFARSRITRKRAICRRPMAPRSCRRICISAKSVRASCGRQLDQSQSRQRVPARIDLARIRLPLAASFSAYARCSRCGKSSHIFPGHGDSPGWLRGSGASTGVPLVDAGMRQLWHTGVMHNRVRMVTGSFLVKNLRLPWQEGARWFWDTLVDADLASNTLNWQWVAGSRRGRSPLFSHLQSGAAGQALRQPGPLRAALGAGTGAAIRA